MRKINKVTTVVGLVLLVLISAVVVLNGSLVVGRSGQQSNDSPYPALAVSDAGSHTLVLDVGTINSNQDTRIRFAVQNQLDSGLSVENIDAGCGCVAAALDHSQIKPGKQGVVELSFDAGRVPTGTFERVARVELRAGEQRIPAQVLLRGKVEDTHRIVVFPARMNLGTLGDRNRLEGDLYVKIPMAYAGSVPSTVQLRAEDSTLDILVSKSDGVKSDAVAFVKVRVVVDAGDTKAVAQSTGRSQQSQVRFVMPSESAGKEEVTVSVPVVWSIAPSPKGIVG